MQEQAGTRPRLRHGAVRRRHRKSGVIEKSSDESANSLRIRRAAGYTARSSVASPKSLTTLSFGAEERNGKPGRLPPQGCGLPDGRDGTSDDAGNKRREPTPGGQQPSPQRPTQRGREKVAGNGRRAGKETADAAENGQRRRKLPQPEPRIRDAAATLRATRRKTHIPRTSPSQKKIRGRGWRHVGRTRVRLSSIFKEGRIPSPKARGLPRSGKTGTSPRTTPG